MIATGSADKTAVVWSTEGENMKLITLQGHTDWVGGVAFSNDVAQLATCSDDKTAVVWNTSSSHQIPRLEGHTNYLDSPDNMLIGTASTEKTAVGSTWLGSREWAAGVNAACTDDAITGARRIIGQVW